MYQRYPGNVEPPADDTCVRSCDGGCAAARLRQSSATQASHDNKDTAIPARSSGVRYVNSTWWRPGATGTARSNRSAVTMGAEAPSTDAVQPGACASTRVT